MTEYEKLLKEYIDLQTFHIAMVEKHKEQIERLKADKNQNFEVHNKMTEKLNKAILILEKHNLLNEYYS